MSQAERRVRRRRGSRWLGRAVAASSLVCAPAHADDMAFGGGFFFGYRFAEQAGFECGFEAFTTYILHGNGPREGGARSGLGPLVQVGLLGTRQLQPRITLALQGGGELERDAFALSGSLGVSYRLGADPGFGLHTGLLSELLFFNAGASYEWFLDQGSVAGGARVMPTFRSLKEQEPDFSGVPGRPLRTDEGLFQLPAAVATCDASVPVQRARTAIEPIGLAFERDAALEAASVPAFLQLASELAGARAPASLIRRALQAAIDEQAHARLTAQLAQRHLGRPAIVRVPEVTRRRALARDAGAIRLALESWVDGCCSEGRAAAQVAAAAARAQDPATRAALARIAADEQRHAELAWSVLDWALHAGGPDARDAVHELESASERDDVYGYEHEHEKADREAHGRLNASTLNAVARAHGERSRARLRSLYGSEV